MPAQRLPWYKVWAEHIEHEKMAELTDSEYRTWHHLLARASTQPERWRFASLKHAAVATGRPIEDIERLLELGLLDNGDGIRMHNARKWQDKYPSDYSANAPATLGEDSVNAAGIPSEDTDTEVRRENVEKEDQKQTQNVRAGTESSPTETKRNVFEGTFRSFYPARSGTPWNWQTVEAHFRKIPETDYEAILTALSAYRKTDDVGRGIIVNPRRFLETWRDFGLPTAQLGPRVPSTNGSWNSGTTREQDQAEADRLEEIRKTAAMIAAKTPEQREADRIAAEKFIESLRKKNGTVAG